MSLSNMYAIPVAITFFNLIISYYLFNEYNKHIKRLQIILTIILIIPFAFGIYSYKFSLYTCLSFICLAISFVGTLLTTKLHSDCNEKIVPIDSYKTNSDIPNAITTNTITTSQTNCQSNSPQTDSLKSTSPQISNINSNQKNPTSQPSKQSNWKYDNFDINDF